MKNILVGFLGVAFSVFIGLLFMDRTEQIAPAVSTSNVAKAFQLGAYNNFDGANTLVDLYGGIVVNDKDYYYVYYSVLQNQNNIEKMIKYLDDNKIYYYVKNVYPNQEYLNNLLNYEELMVSTTSDIAFIELNKRLIESYGE